MVRIAIDCMGGDHGLTTTIPACLRFLKQYDDVELILVGRQAEVEGALLKKKALEHPRITIRHASEVVAMDEPPAQALRNIVATNDDRPRTMHTVAARTDRESLPDRVAALLDRDDYRRARRTQAWRQHTAQTHAREAAFQRLSATRHDHLGRERSRGRNRGYGLEL